MLDRNDKCWFVLRDLKRANAKEPAYIMLRHKPMIDRVFTPIVDNVPYIRDLVFAYASYNALEPIVAQTPTLQFRFARGCVQNEPMTVGTAEMDRFVNALAAADKAALQVEFFTPETLPATALGKRIRIIGGEFDGYEGRLLTRRGSRKRKLVLDLGTLLSAAFEVEPERIQVLD